MLSLAVLLPEAKAQNFYSFGRNKVQYNDFDWHVLETEHFDIYYYPEMLELAEHGAYFAEEAYDELQNKFAFSLTHRVPLIFYSSNLHFKETNVTSGFIPDGVGGFFEFLKGRVVIPANGNLHRFRRVVRHEMVHVFTYNKLLRVMRDHRRPTTNFLPLWFTEGIAEYWSGEPDHQHEMIIRDALFTNYLVPLESMYRINGSFIMYKQGEAICRFISEEYGEEKLLELINNFWKDRDFRVVMEVTVQEEFEVIAEKWQAWLKKQYFPEMDDIEVPSLIAEGLSTEGFNAKPNYFQFADGSRKVYYVGNRDGFSNVFEIEVDENFEPVSDPDILIEGERSDEFESFHLFESRISVSASGKLAFVTKSGGRDVVHVYDLVADDLVDTYEFDDLVAVYSPSWSPDESRLVFTAIDNGGFSDLYVFHRQEGRLQQLTDDTYDDRDPSWSPDGSLIAFSSDRTEKGRLGAYNIFTYSLDDGHVRYVTYGDRTDLSPSWSPDGTQLAFISTSRDSTGHYGAQDVWVADMTEVFGGEPAVASADDTPSLSGAPAWRSTRKLTNLAAAAFDPVWIEEDRILFSSFEGLSFSVRQLDNLDSLLVTPKKEEFADLSSAGGGWEFGKLEVGEDVKRRDYKRKYKLDLAQGMVSQSPVLGTTGGAVLAFSDMLGDDYLYFTLLNTGSTTRDFLDELSFQVARFQLGRRANIGYGAYRFSGLRYDLTDPDAPTEFPLFFETIYGGFGLVSFPISKFKRIDLESSLNWSRKEINITQVNRDALLLSNSVSLVHDNALYWMNGPIDGWRARATVAYTSDIAWSNVSYFTLAGDVRKYFRLADEVTLAHWFMGRINEGQEARLWVLGGSWDLRGFRLFDVRGQKMWFTSHELRFPLIKNPSVWLPLLSPLGIASLRGSLFFDAAHAWNDDYDQILPQINAGETIGSTGVGFRLNLFGAFVLRYDIGYRYRNGFKDRERTFKQFFFGWDF